MAFRLVQNTFRRGVFNLPFPRLSQPSGVAFPVQMTPFIVSSRRPFISGLIDRIRNRMQADPELQKSQQEWDKHLEENPDLKEKLEKAQDAAQKAASAVVTGVKVSADVAGTVAVKVGEGAQKVGQIVKDTGAIDAVAKAADTVSQSAVGRVVGRVVDSTVRDLTREGTVYPTRPMIAASPTDAVAAQQTDGAAPGDAGAGAAAATAGKAATASGESAATTAATSTATDTAAAAGATTATATAATESSGATAAEGAASADAAAGAAPGGSSSDPQNPFRHSQALSTRPRNIWERASARIREFEHSPNPFLRTAFHVTSAFSKIEEVLSTKMMSETEMAIVIREARAIDPRFTPELFVRYVRDSIPLLHRALAQGDLAMIGEFAGGRALTEFTQLVASRKEMGLQVQSKMLDIDHIELLTGKKQEDDLNLVVTFHSQQFEVVRDKSGKVVAGSENEVRQQVTMAVYVYFPEQQRWKLTEMQLIANNTYL